jgi:hypothetical protein
LVLAGVQKDEADFTAQGSIARPFADLLGQLGQLRQLGLEPLQQLLPLVYEELRKLAAQKLASGVGVNPPGR